MSPLDGIRLVVFDLDGTLLPDTKVLPARARRVATGLRAAGIDVALATGKGWTLTERYALEMEIDAPCVALEGALIAHPRGAALRRLTVSAGERQAIAAAVEDLGLSWFFTEDGSRIHASRCLANVRHLLQMWDPDVVLSDAHLATDVLGDAHVLHLVGRPDAVDEASQRLAAVDLPHLDIFRAEFWGGDQQIQVRPPGTGKHLALRYILATRGLPAAAMMACGDWWNDVEMVRMAGVGVAPSDAVEGVRKVADHVVAGTSNDEAILRFVEDALAAL